MYECKTASLYYCCIYREQEAQDKYGNTPRLERKFKSFLFLFHNQRYVTILSYFACLLTSVVLHHHRIVLFHYNHRIFLKWCYVVTLVVVRVSNVFARDILFREEKLIQQLLWTSFPSSLFGSCIRRVLQKHGENFQFLSCTTSKQRGREEQYIPWVCKIYL